MKAWRIVTAVSLVFLMILSAGCKDITDSYKPGSFGKTAEEKAMVEAITERYGDLTEKGEPRFLEVTMTSNVVKAIPVDKVTKYSKDAKKLFAWFVYDNFENDTLHIKWIYLKDNFTIHTFEAKTGEDFGRGTFILEQPDDGWPLGGYRVIISGRGIEESVDFEIIDGATVSTPIDFAQGKITLPTQPGWYMTHWEYEISSVDVTLVGPIERVLMGTSSRMYDRHIGEGQKNDFSHTSTRTDASSGALLASGSYHVTWTDPPDYLAPNQKVSIQVNREMDSNWNITKMNVKFNEFGLYGLDFATSDGTTYIDSYNGPMTSVRAIPPPWSGPNNKIILVFHLGNSYYFKYFYEWRE